MTSMKPASNTEIVSLYRLVLTVLNFIDLCNITLVADQPGRRRLLFISVHISFVPFSSGSVEADVG